MTPDHLSPFEARIKASLDDNMQSIDAATQQRLNAMRRAALNQPANTHRVRMQYWLPATSLAFCTLVGMMLWLPTQTPAPMANLEHSAMLELMDSPEELDVMSDPAFYLWLDEADMPAPKNGAQHAV